MIQSDRILTGNGSSNMKKEHILLMLSCIDMELEVQYVGQSYVDSEADLKVRLH